MVKLHSMNLNHSRKKEIISWCDYDLDDRGITHKMFHLCRADSFMFPQKSEQKKKKVAPYQLRSWLVILSKFINR